jgi:hypothetical protein
MPLSAGTIDTECCRVGERCPRRLRRAEFAACRREWVTQHAVTGDLAGECRERLLVTDAPEVTAVADSP